MDNANLRDNIEVYKRKLGESAQAQNELEEDINDYRKQLDLTIEENKNFKRRIESLRDA